jgi:hypothetical protein
MKKDSKSILSSFNDQEIIQTSIQNNGFTGVRGLKKRFVQDRKGYEGKLDVNSLRITICEAFDQGLLPTEQFELFEPQTVLDGVLPLVIDQWHKESPMKYLTSLKYLILGATDYRKPELDFIQIQAALNKRELLWFKKAYYEELYSRVRIVNAS